ncbi:MAG TPA: hypothetical protein O0W79_00080 [Methanocorpusculum sp.]|nr:hypothetical protein [Methanocorpusculum sp.]
MDAQQIQQITDRISLKLQEKGVSPDTQSIFDKLAAYINDFGIVPFEAERKVQADLYKKYNLPEESRSESKGAGLKGDTVTHLSDIAEGDWVTVEVKVVSLQTPRSPSFSQGGVVADSFGAVQFTVFSKAIDIPVLEENKWYRIESAVVDSYRNILSLKVHSGTKVSEISEDRILVPAVPTPLSNIKPGVIPCIQVKYVDEWESRSERMMQTGLLADTSGRTKFVLWQDPKKEKLTLGTVYTIYYATVDEFNGRYSIGLNSAMWLESEDSNLSSLPVKTGEVVVPNEDLPITSIHDLKPGYASVRVKFIEEWESRSDKMLQTGLVGDETGRMKFVLWKDDIKQPLELNRVYVIKNVKVDEYNGRLSITLNRSEYTAENENTELIIGTKLDELSGSLVQIGKGSGLIKRCPVEGCGRVLSKPNLCPVHEIQTNFNYDMRIRGVLDDGQKAYNILMNREITEKISNITMDEAIEISTTSPLGADDVQILLTEKVCGRYLKCLGSWFNDLFLVKEVEFMKFNKDEAIALLNSIGTTEAH